MGVTVNRTKDVDGTKQWVFITLTVDGDICEQTTVQPWNSDVPVLSGQELTDWCITQTDRYKIEILKQMYPDCPYRSFTLEEMEQWIKDGCIISAKIEGEPNRVAEKVEWTNKHPSPSLEDQIDELKAKLEALTVKVEKVTEEV